MTHIEEVIRLEGGNEYQEGRLRGKPKVRMHSWPLWLLKIVKFQVFSRLRSAGKWASSVCAGGYRCKKPYSLITFDGVRVKMAYHSCF